MNNTEPTTDVVSTYPVQIKVITYVLVMAPPQCLALSVCIRVHLFVCPTPPLITPYNNWEINLHLNLQNSAISSNSPSSASSYLNIQFLTLATDPAGLHRDYMSSKIYTNPLPSLS